jgi:anti-sigma28 factor (negative regulator of flagellin synthesis)
VTTYLHMTVRIDAGRRDEARRDRVQELRRRIERDEYAVDAQKVADAILRRLVHEASPPPG